MAFGGGFFGGGESNKKTVQSTQSENLTMATEQNVQLGGSAQNFISPGAAVSSGGGASILASPKANVTANVTTTGYSATDVQSLFNTVFTENAADRSAIAGLAGSMADAQAAQGEQLTAALASTRAPDQSTLSSLLPLLIVGALVYLLKGR